MLPVVIGGAVLVVLAVIALALRPNREASLRDAAARVGAKLAELYGKSDEYRPARVERALTEARVADKWLPHCLALFSSQAEFAAHPACRGLDHRALRIEMENVRRLDREHAWGGGTIDTHYDPP